MSAIAIVAVAVAGALGALLRYGITLALGRRRSRIPLAVLVVNATGSALGGAALALGKADILSTDTTTIVLAGLCGGLTTFSTLGVETVQLARSGRRRIAAGSMVANLAAGLGFAALAYLAVGAVA